MTARPDDERPLPGWGWLAALFVLAAVLGEAIAGQYGAATPSPSWQYVVVPATWHPSARAAWWLLVAGAAGAFRLAERRAGIRRNPLIVLGSTVPFLAFAVGAGLSAEWAAWH
ncbi:MAG: hypothetical protein ACR2HR_11105 [Euzebya sp.]